MKTKTEKAIAAFVKEAKKHGGTDREIIMDDIWLSAGHEVDVFNAICEDNNLTK